MTNLRKAAQQALEALDGLSEDAVCQSSHHAKKDQHTSLDVCPVFLRLRAAITALRAALAEPVQEPVAWYQKRGQEVLTSHPACWGREDEPWTPLYTAPPQRKPLTEEEIRRIIACIDKFTPVREGMRQLARAIERAHGIGEQP